MPNETVKRRWLRKCDECDHTQVAPKAPVYGEEPSDSFCQSKCKGCGTRGSLSYGSYEALPQDDKWWE